MGLRTGPYLNQYRRMVDDYILPAMKSITGRQPPKPPQQALRHELALSARTKGVPATDLAFNDAPET